MANKSRKNQDLGWFVYYRDTGEKVRVNKEQHDAFYAEADCIRHREQYYGRCKCPQHYKWVCDGECLGCQFHVTDEMVSLDETDANGSGAYDSLPDESKPIDEVIADRDLINRLFDVLRTLDPDADTIIRLWEEHPEGISDSDIARSLGRPRMTVVNQLRRYRSVLRKFLDE